MQSDHTFGGRVIGETLVDEGVECLFGVHGAQWGSIEEACRRGAQLYHFRHEASAGFAADAYARCTRKPGVCFVSMAAGMANMLAPLYHARGSLSPLVVMVSQHHPGRDGLSPIQEGYAERVFADACKWTHRILDWRTDAFWIRKALKDSVSFPPGPIALSIPQTAQGGAGPDRQRHYVPSDRAPVIPQPAGDPAFVERAVAALLKAERPLLIAGDGVYWSDGAAELQELAELLQIPTATRRTARGALPETHPLAFTQECRDGFAEHADLVCLIGMQVTALDRHFEPPAWSAGTRFIQIQENPELIWYGLPTPVAVVGSPRLVLRQMIDCVHSLAKSVPDRKAWVEQLAKTRMEVTRRRAEKVKKQWGLRPIHPDVLGAEICNFLDPTATLIYDSYSGSHYLTDKVVASREGHILDAGLHQHLGHSIGMAIGAQVARPGKQVLAQIGDGGFGLSGMDMETMLRYRLPAVVVLLNNDSWGGRTIGGPLYFPKHGSWDNLPDIRYDRMFAELGCHAEYVTTAEEIRPALERSFNSGLPSLINVRSEATKTSRRLLPIWLVMTWMRGNFAELPAEAQDELRRQPFAMYRAAAAFARDDGCQVSAEELADMVGKAERD